MRPRAAALALALVAACGGSTTPTTTTITPPAATTIAGSPSTAAPVTECPAAPYRLDYLPPAVGTSELDAAGIEPDIWTQVGGSHTTFYGREDGTVAIALIRGTLPVVDWPGDKGEVLIDGTRAAVGPHEDGTWVAGWYEAPGERCDLYTMVFYPPVQPSEVESTLGGMNRVGG